MDALIARYPTGGCRAVQRVLPERSLESIRGKAAYLKLNITGRAPLIRHESTEWIDAQIRRAYRQPRPGIKALAALTGCADGWLKYRARLLGLCAPVGAASRWTEPELALLTEGRNASRGIDRIHTLLRAAGFNRTLSAIKNKLADLEIGYARSWYSAQEVAQLMGVSWSVVRRWIDKGALKARRGVGPSSEKTLAEVELRFQMHQIDVNALRAFMRAYPHEWDHRRLRKEVLLDLLLGGESGLNSGAFGKTGQESAG